jgi:acyl-coenzyme A synthetase/AMP-(fatty) acid ligase
MLLVAAAPGMPSFHMMGVSFQLLHPLYTGRPSGIFRPMYPHPPPVPSPETILEALKALKPSIAFVVPSILEIWIHDHDAVEFLKTVDTIVRIPLYSHSHLFITS